MCAPLSATHHQLPLFLCWLLDWRQNHVLSPHSTAVGLKSHKEAMHVADHRYQPLFNPQGIGEVGPAALWQCPPCPPPWGVGCTARPCPVLCPGLYRT